MFRFRLSIGKTKPVLHFSKNCKKLMQVQRNKIAKIYTIITDSKKID